MTVCSLLKRSTGARPGRTRRHSHYTTRTGPSNLSAAASPYESFCERVSGEWKGALVTFSSDGTPQELPHTYVPDAFREWGIQVCHWQEQCSMTVSTEELIRRTKLLMPTVGCEADAVAFEEEQGAAAASGLAYMQDGSYSVGPDRLAPEDLEVALESCVFTSATTRLRFEPKFTRCGGDKGNSWSLISVRVFQEEFSGDYDGGAFLDGCGGGLDGFENRDRLSHNALQGGWEVAQAAAYAPDAAGQLVAAVFDPGTSMGADSSDRGNVMCLPLGAFVWSDGSVDGLEVECGVVTLSEDGPQRRTARRVYRDGKLKCVSLSVEVAA